MRLLLENVDADRQETLAALAAICGVELASELADVSQSKPTPNGGYTEQTAYTFYGTTHNGLIVVIASYSGGGSGIFYTLHIVDVAAARGYDIEGKVYQRINLTNVRSVILGDRWEGELKISGNAIRIITTKNGPADDSARAPETITAERL